MIVEKWAAWVPISAEVYRDALVLRYPHCAFRVTPFPMIRLFRRSR